MVKQPSKQAIDHKWWFRILLAAIFLAVSYGFISLAIDSGSLIEYALAIFFLVWGVRYFVFAIKRSEKT